jgi:hypothetical protein
MPKFGVDIALSAMSAPNFGVFGARPVVNEVRTAALNGVAVLVYG